MLQEVIVMAIDRTTKRCPNPQCYFHNPENAVKKRWYQPHGYYSSTREPITQYKRYRCSACGKTFSETYFTRDWHLRRRDIDEMELLFEWCKGTSMKELTKIFKCSIGAIENRIKRMLELAKSKDVILEIERSD